MRIFNKPSTHLNDMANLHGQEHIATSDDARQEWVEQATIIGLVEIRRDISLGILFCEEGRAGRGGCQLHDLELALDIATMDDLDQQAFQIFF